MPELQPTLDPHWTPFPDLSWLRGGISLRADGGMSWDQEPEEIVVQRRAAYFERMNLNMRSAVGADQVHETRIAKLGRTDAPRGMFGRADRIPLTDALITGDSGLVLTTLHADCAPVYYADPVHRVVALAHCGWRGTAAGLAGKVLGLMTANFGSDPRKVRVAFGPTISSAVYEVGADVAAQFAREFGDVSVRQECGKPFVDLAAALTIDLLRSGLDPHAIPPRPPCTCANLNCASYRRDGLPTRSMLAWLVREA
jgi:polyphenol oxidase